MWTITPDMIAEYQRLYEAQTGKSISDDQAYVEAASLCELIALLYELPETLDQ
jgi:hypothetical protein